MGCYAVTSEHPVSHSTGPDWPPKFKDPFFGKELKYSEMLISDVICEFFLSGLPKFDLGHLKSRPSLAQMSHQLSKLDNIQVIFCARVKK